ELAAVLGACGDERGARDVLEEASEALRTQGQCRCDRADQAVNRLAVIDCQPEPSRSRFKLARNPSLLFPIVRLMSGVITRMIPGGSSSTRRVTRVPCPSGSQILVTVGAILPIRPRNSTSFPGSNRDTVIVPSETPIEGLTLTSNTVPTPTASVEERTSWTSV